VSWNLPKLPNLTSAASPRVDILSTCKVRRKLECPSLCWQAHFWRDHPAYCTAESGNPGGTYELPCVYIYIYIYIYTYFLPFICFSSVSSSYIISLCYILVSLLAFLTQLSTCSSYPNKEASLGFRRVGQGLHDLTTKDTDMYWHFCTFVSVCVYNERVGAI
jgi:hypothetical protein